jgi:ubiquinone/menaquinone biosynthesis C-methylase UbiE
MDRPRVDYDQLSQTYHSRYDSSKLVGIADALLQLAKQCSARLILEVGCGTGMWIETLRSTGVTVLGVDSSQGMLTQASTRLGSAGLVRAHANQLPFSGGRFDLIYCVNALHHFDDPQAFINDAAALLKPGGALALVGIDPRTIQRRYYYYDYFDGTLETDLRRYPSFGQLVDWTSAAGLNDVELRIVDRWWMCWEGRAIFEDPFLKKESNSALALLTQEAYEAGLGRIRKAVEDSEASQEPVEFRSEIPFGIVSGVNGTRPSDA